MVYGFCLKGFRVDGFCCTARHVLDGVDEQRPVGGHGRGGHEQRSIPPGKRDREAQRLLRILEGLEDALPWRLCFTPLTY